MDRKNQLDLKPGGGDRRDEGYRLSRRFWRSVSSNAGAINPKRRDVKKGGTREKAKEGEALTGHKEFFTINSREVVNRGEGLRLRELHNCHLC